LNLNSKQRKVFVLGLLLIIGICLFPPWIQTFSYKSTYSESSLGYGFIAKPPSPISLKRQYGVKIDIERLILQLVAVMALSGIGIIAFREKAANKKINKDT
jgi:hypothetical protein